MYARARVCLCAKAAGGCACFRRRLLSRYVLGMQTNAGKERREGMLNRWRLAVLEKKNSSIYLYNGILMMVLFFVARILFYGMGLFHLCLNWCAFLPPHMDIHAF